MKKLTINKVFWSDIVRACIFSMIATLLSVLLFALAIKFFTLNDVSISVINQVIKVVSLLLGCLFGLKATEKGAAKGLVIGMLYYFISLFVFAMVTEGFTMAKINIFDLLASGIIGMICGILTVNVKK